jgi:chromate reductase, NAD(P)H dehydrogenase (quinone)
VRTILGLSGSLRAGSLNAALLRAAVELAPDDVTIEIGSIRGIPLYDGDVEASEGIPPVVSALKERVVACDALLLVTPEYNNSIPGVFKNAIDWLSRPVADIPRVFGRKPVGVIGASPGRFGTLLSQTAWLPVLRVLGTRPYYGANLYLSGAAKAFDAGGKLVDAETRGRLEKYLEGFAKSLG